MKAYAARVLLQEVDVEMTCVFLFVFFLMLSPAISEEGLHLFLFLLWFYVVQEGNSPSLQGWLPLGN